MNQLISSTLAQGKRLQFVPIDKQLMGNLSRKFAFAMYLIAGPITYGMLTTSTPIEIIRIFTLDVPSQSAVQAAVPAGAAIGSFCIQLYADKLGKIQAQLLACSLLVAIYILMTIRVHWIYLMVLQFLAGFLTANYFYLYPLVISEYATPKLRPMFMCTFSILINCGLFVGYFLNVGIQVGSDGVNFWAMYIMGAILSFLQVVGTLWLYKEGPPPVETVKTTEMQNIKSKQAEMIESENNTENLSTTSQFKPYEMVHETSLRVENGPKKHLSRRAHFQLTIISISLGVSQMTTGITAILSYASLIFRGVFNSKYSGAYGSVMLGLVNAAAVSLAMPVINRFKRKTLMWVGYYGTVVGSVINAIAFGLELQWLKILGFIVFVIFYQLAPGPINLMLTGEIYPPEFKVRYTSVRAVSNWLTNIAVVYTYQFYKPIGQWVAFTVFAIVTSILAVPATALLPETFGRPLVDIENEIRAR